MNQLLQLESHKSNKKEFKDYVRLYDTGKVAPHSSTLIS
jgi:hypothetical protein